MTDDRERAPRRGHDAQRRSRRTRVTLAAIVAVALALAWLAAPPGIAHAQAQGVPAAEGESERVIPLPDGFTRKMADRIDAVIGQVHRIRGLEASSPVAYRVIDGDQVRAELQAALYEESPPESLAAEDALYTRLGLLGPEDDLEELLLSIYESQVLAFYDPRNGMFTFVGGIDRIGAFEEIVVAHEYEHALQDQRWDLDDPDAVGDPRSDANLAYLALVEGDATALMYDWAARELNMVELLGVAGEALTRQDARTLRKLPPILRRQLEFPYLDGFGFVNELRGRGDSQSATGDWETVDEAFEARPASTEQILHPMLYPDELPVEVELPDVASLMGLDWDAAMEHTLGEMQIGVWVADGRKGVSLLPGLPAPLPKADAAAGWGGDRLVSLDGPLGSWALVWQTAWDSGKDAREFRKAARAAMKDLAGANDVSDDDIAGGLSSPILVLVADSRETLRAVQAALGLR